MPNPINRLDYAIGGLLATLFLVMLLLTLDIGYSRDEGFYFNAGEQYSHWFDVLAKDPKRAFTKAEVNKAFKYNGEHPALPKIMFGLSWRLFGKMQDPEKAPWSKAWYHQRAPPKTMLGIMSEATAMRFPALVTNSFLIFLLYIFAARYTNRRVALAATIGWMLTPHAFWHSHFSCFDMPMVTMSFATAYCFYRSVTLPGPEPGRTRPRGSWRWAILTAVVWGLALNTKHNAFFLPIIFLMWWVWHWRKDFKFSWSGRGLQIPPIPLAFFAMLFISPLIYYALWPRLWFDPIGHLKWYFGFHAKHVFYWAYYYGTLFTKPPFPVAFPFVMSAMTLSGMTAILAVVGLAHTAWLRIFRPIIAKATSITQAPAPVPVPAPSPVLANGILAQTPGLTSFLLLNFLVPFAVIAHPQTPIFGGTKHWMPGVPFLMIFAGVAFDRILTIATQNRHRWSKAIITALIALAFIVPATRDTLHGYTNGSTFYNAFFGGFGAMGKHKMQREFWGNTAYSTLSWLNEEAPPNAKVDFHDSVYDAIRFYWRDGMLRKDIKPAWKDKNADIYLFHWHKEFLDLEADARHYLDSPIPTLVIEQDGVPLLNAYYKGGKQ